MKTYLVTGGCGFIGSYVIEELLKRDDIACIYNIDKMGVGSSSDNISKDKRVITFFDDICHDDFVTRGSNLQYKVDYILHLAAESHVDRSIDNPLAFVDSNLKGTANVLELARKLGARMVHVSTDEVYGHLLAGDAPFTEEHPLKPRSPYAASKAGSDLLVQSYATTFDLDVSITRCCNNYGPRQHSEKLIPTVVNSIASGKKVPVYGDGKNCREWIHAEDHAKAIIEILLTGEPNTVYNLSGSRLVSNLDLIEEIIAIIENYHPKYSRRSRGATGTLRGDYVEFVADRLGHDFMYNIASKHDLLSIQTQKAFDLRQTVEFYISNFSS